MTARVLVPIAESCEELETVTIVDLLRRAGIDVTIAALEPGPVTMSRGVVILPDAELEDVIDHEYDMLVLPGGMPGAEHLNNDARIIALIQKMAAANRYTAAICAAPMALASAGVLQGKQATSFPAFHDKLTAGGAALSADAVACDGKVITSRGPGTAMDFALQLIESLLGKEQRDAVEAPLQRP
ncbi:DJ-1 family glyoxalase III [Magnetofaba australis]|uniref:Putative protease n=1 Tax=Magnetofaba australis IT-1 TaxID=1434232 RepID=A0A1Y2K629_9PROT|nr:DJ-1 family glyoxalase III [Magnetofaba australis]OSM04980.1 putative protease [Magnetofaba australis IT-1]